MSEQAIAFVEQWVLNHIHADGTPPHDTSRAAALAQRCMEDAQAAGIPQAEMLDAYDDLTAYMAGEIEDANHPSSPDEDAVTDMEAAADETDTAEGGSASGGDATAERNRS